MLSRFEQYIETVEINLKHLPAPQRAEELAEIREHISSMIAARMELGEPAAMADEEALRQFGQPKQVARGLIKTQWRGKLLVVRDVTAAIICLTVQLFLDYRLATSHRFPVLNSVVGFYCVPLFTMIMGVITGLIAPRRAVPCAAALFTCFFIVSTCDYISRLYDRYESVTNVHESITIVLVNLLVSALTIVTTTMGAEWGQRYSLFRLKRARAH